MDKALWNGLKSHQHSSSLSVEEIDIFKTHDMMMIIRIYIFNN